MINHEVPGYIMKDPEGYWNSFDLSWCIMINYDISQSPIESFPSPKRLVYILLLIKKMLRFKAMDIHERPPIAMTLLTGHLQLLSLFFTAFSILQPKNAHCTFDSHLWLTSAQQGDNMFVSLCGVPSDLLKLYEGTFCTMGVPCVPWCIRKIIVCFWAHLYILNMPTLSYVENDSACAPWCTKPLGGAQVTLMAHKVLSYSCNRPQGHFQ